MTHEALGLQLQRKASGVVVELEGEHERIVISFDLNLQYVARFIPEVL